VLKRVGVPVLLAAALAAGCGGRALPEPAPPVLDGHRIMLIPVRAGDPPAVDAELAYWLPQRSPGVEWVLPGELQRIVDRAPALRVRLDAMPRDIVGAGRRSAHLVDPAYGDLRMLGAVADATLALMPVAVREAEGSPAGLELTVALVDVRGGSVVWMRSVTGLSADGTPHGAAGAVAEALARALFPELDGG
jgi:hypothetical protein